MKKKILIVGGTGFIGYHLAKKSLEKNWKVSSISLTRPQKKRYLPGVKYILCDISKKESLFKKIKGTYDYVINLGGHVDHSNKTKTFNSHYIGCKNLSNFFQHKNIKRFIQIGSGGEYGSLKSPHFETQKGRPNAVYAKAKLLATNYLLSLNIKKKFPCTIIRLYQVYGPKQDTNRFLPVLITNCIKNKSFKTSSGIQYRDFIHIDDVIIAIFKSCKSKKAIGKIINIATGKPINIKQIILFIKKICSGGEPDFGKIKLRKDENKRTYPNIQRSKSLLQWKPRIKFYDGIKKTIKSYNEKK